jgi:hypothetical protein
MDKICSNCKKPKPLSEFWKRARAKDGHCDSCKDCVSLQNSQSYKNNWTKNRSRIDANHRKHIAETREKVNQIKHSAGCKFCPETEPVCLDFHHLDKATKTKSISTLITNHATWQAILDEIAKCVVSCANCHRKIHAGLIKI